MTIRLALAIFFAAAGIARAQAPLPSAPAQPATGPGGSGYPHAAVHKFGPFDAGARSYYLYEPADPSPPSAPVIVFVHGYTGLNPGLYGGWIEHLVRRGNVVVFPIYQDGLAGAPGYTADAMAAVLAAFRTLRTEPGHVRPDPQNRWALAGHSLGCPIAANIAGEAAAQGLPRPRALLLCNAGNGNSALKGLPSILEPPSKIPDLLLVAVVGADDRLVGATTARQIFEGSTRVASANKNLITLLSDRTGAPPALANHLACLSWNPAYDNSLDAGKGAPASPLRALLSFGSMGVSALLSGSSALNYYGYWKWLDGLTDAAFFDQNRAFALGDTPEQKFLGRWSNGVPVKQPFVELGR